MGQHPIISTLRTQINIMKRITLLLTLALTTQLFAQEKQRVEETVKKATIKSHIGFLASDIMRGRDTPSPELKIAAEYIKSRFEEYGVQSLSEMGGYLQPVPMMKIVPPTEGQITVGETAYKLLDDFLWMDGDKRQLEAPLVFVNFGMEGVTEKQVKGKVVIALCGDGESQSPQKWFNQSKVKGKKLQEMGAVALIELYNSNKIPWRVLRGYLNREQVVLDDGGRTGFTRIWMNRSKEDAQSLDQDDTLVKIAMELGDTRKFVSQNVVGYVEGADPKLKDEYIVYAAHYDHVGVGRADARGDTIYNGARDNAVGTVTVLSAAENLAQYPTKRSALFVLFTAEEKGLLGSQYYIENTGIDLDKIVYCFNSDNGGYNDTSLATIIGLTRTTAEAMIKQSCKTFGLEAIEDPAPEQGLFDRSDNVRFAAKGIPAPTFSMGFTAFDKEITKYYHQPSDEPESMDFDYLEKFFKAYVLSCRQIGNADEAPFWVEGDKYYEAGVELYGE